MKPGVKCKSKTLIQQRNKSYEPVCVGAHIIGATEVCGSMQ